LISQPQKFPTFSTKLTNCSLPERFRAFFGHDFSSGIDDTGVCRLTTSCDNLQACLDDISRSDERSGRDTGDGTSSEKSEWVIVTGERESVRVNFVD
jgi:hypothetical protein